MSRDYYIKRIMLLHNVFSATMIKTLNKQDSTDLALLLRFLKVSSYSIKNTIDKLEYQSLIDCYLFAKEHTSIFFFDQLNNCMFDIGNILKFIELETSAVDISR